MGLARQLFVLIVSLSIASALRCYSGTDQQCTVAQEMNDCGGEACRCVKYRFRCSADDHACSAREQSSGAIKWAYTVVGATTCEQLKTLSSVYLNAQCCSTNRCNRPDSGKCSWAQARRRSLRRLTNLLDLE